MPDPIRKTISATQASTLFDANPYQTLWMLYRWFEHGDEVERESHSRMDWGLKMQPLLLEAATHDLKLVIEPNLDQDGKEVYVRSGLFGCTRDAEILCPERGRGALETKCVFDYRTWMVEWAGGNKVPRHYEIQLQTQMKVGDGEQPYSWGVFAVWVAGEMFYFERKPVPKFWEAMDIEAKQFFQRLERREEPDPFGLAVESPLLDAAFPIEEGSVLDMREAEQGREIAEQVRRFEYHRANRLWHEKGEDAIKAKLRALAKANETVLLPGGINFKLKQNKKSVGIKTYVPKDLPEGEIGYVQ